MKQACESSLEDKDTRFGIFLGCYAQTEQYACELSARQVLPKLDIDLVEIKGAACCGFPLNSIDNLTWTYLTARNLALCEDQHLDMLPVCNGCHLSMCEVKQTLQASPELKEKINSLLASEDLRYEGVTKVRHMIELLHDDIGPERIQKAISKPLVGLKFAAHYGCHALRPSELGRPDDSRNPTKLETLIGALGARWDIYPERLDCCGAGIAVSAGESSLKIAGAKLERLRTAGFDGLVTTCPFCMRMYDARQEAIGALLGRAVSFPVFYYTQLLGLCMGIDQASLGLHLNMSPVDEVIQKFQARTV
jgi:heterodisulfide reductase subunit B